MNVIDYCLTILVSSFHRVSSVHGLVLGCLLCASFIAGTKVFGGLGNFKEKLRLLDSLVPDTDKLPETVRITFLKEAVQQNPDLRQIHVLDSLCKYKEGSTGQLSLELYYDLLWNAASQHDLNKDTKKPPKKVSSLTNIHHLMIWNMNMMKQTIHVTKIRMTPILFSFSILFLPP